ncbi:MAG TPA: ATP-binding protein [Pseudonocardiaceae bacterium]|nr:ATP-binding protein [Pseudonocardiaceae bacterium]
MGDENHLDHGSAQRLATALSTLLETTRELVTSEAGSALVQMVTRHIGCPLAQVPNVAIAFGAWEHVNVQRGVDAYLAAHSPDATWFGIAGGGRSHQDVIDMLTTAGQSNAFQLGAVDYATVATGPDSVTEAVQLGLVATVSPTGAPVVITVRGPSEFHGPHLQAKLQILAADRATATATRDEVERLMRRHDAFRGAILQFDVSDQRGNELISFLPRPELTAAQVVLPAGVLETLERHVVRGAEYNARLVALGQHLKRGLLLYGPPGTGKTHTVRYLISRLTDATVVVLSGRALRLLPAASALVRRLQPAVLVIEDVDLIAQERRGPEGTNPLLFELLNRIDGVDADADVTFVLTTNRVEVLEQALVDRPGRVDLAVEIPKPDTTERTRLLRLYTKDVALDLPDPTDLVAAMEGVTASFVRELVRRAVLAQLDHTTNGDSVTLTGTVLHQALTELSSERHAVTSRILGGS